MKSFEKYRDEEFVGVAALEAASARAIREFGESDENRDRVQWEAPNARTIRFYLSEGLLPKADETDGTRSVFTYRHLLTLMVIRRMQALGIPIKTISQIIRNRDIKRLEELITEPVHISTEWQAAQHAHERGEEVMEINDPEEIEKLGWEADSAPRVLYSLRKNADSSTESSQVFHQSLQSFFNQTERRTAEAWDHYTIGVGIELHISHRSELTNREKRKLVREVRRLLSAKE